MRLPNSMLDSLAAALASAAGLYHSPGGTAVFVIPLAWGQVLIPLLVIGTVLLLRSRPTPPSRTLLPFLAMPVAYWAAIGVVSSSLRPQGSTRYQLLGVVLLILLYAHLASGVKVRRFAGVSILATFLAAAAANAGSLADSGAVIRRVSDQHRAELAAVELVHDRVDTNFVLEQPGISPSLPDDMLITAGQYFAAARAYGSPAFSLVQLQREPEQIRQAADVELVRALGLAPKVASAPTAPSGPPFSDRRYRCRCRAQGSLRALGSATARCYGGSIRSTAWLLDHPRGRPASHVDAFPLR